MNLNPSAARSLAEGLEETLTVHRLHMPPQLRKTLASTNVIESAFSVVERVCVNVKRWHGGDQRERWVASGLLVAEKQFRRIQGYKQISVLLRELENSVPSKSDVVKRRKVAWNAYRRVANFRRKVGHSQNHAHPPNGRGRDCEHPTTSGPGTLRRS
jgi:hypothetical protein